MTRQTSIDAYRKIEAQGLLKKRKWEIYHILFQSGPLTATEVARRLPGRKSESVGANVHARLGEMREMGCVAEVGERKCPSSGMNVYLWDVTAALPRKLAKEKAPTRNELISEMYSLLDAALPFSQNFRWRNRCLKVLSEASKYLKGKKC